MKRIKNFYKNNIVLQSKWGLNCIFTITAGIVICIIVALFFAHSLQRETDSKNQVFLNAQKYNIDNVIITAKHNMYQVMSSTTVSEFLTGTFADSRELIVSGMYTSRALSEIAQSNYWLENICVYSDKNNRIANINGSYSAEDFYLNHMADSMSREEFYAFLSAEESYTDICIDGTNYIANIVHKKNSLNNLTYILLLNPEKVFENFTDSNFSDFGAFALFYRDGTAFMYYNNAVCTQTLDLDYDAVSKSDSSSRKIHFNGRKYLLTTSSSSIDDFVYIYFDDYNRTQHNMASADSCHNSYFDSADNFRLLPLYVYVGKLQQGL